MKQSRWSSEIHGFIHKLIPHSVGMAVFDFDNTLTIGDFGELVMNELSKNPNPYLKTLLEKEFRTPNPPTGMILKRYKELLVEKGMESAYRWTSFLFSGDSPQVLKEKSLRIWKEGMDKKSIRIAPEILELCKHLRDHGWERYIVTASPTLIIQPVSEFFLISPENVLGMELKLDGSIVSQNILEPFTYGEGKVCSLKNRTNRIPDLAFGDSRNDLPLLLYSKQGILLSRGDVSLERELSQEGIFLQKGFT